MDKEPNELQRAHVRIDELEEVIRNLVARVESLEAQNLTLTRGTVRADLRNITDPFEGKRDAPAELKRMVEPRLQRLIESRDLRKNIAGISKLPEINEAMDIFLELFKENEAKLREEEKKGETPRIKHWRELNDRAKRSLGVLPMFFERLRRIKEEGLDEEWLKLKGFDEEELRLYQGFMCEPYGNPAVEMPKEHVENLTKIFYESLSFYLFDLILRLHQELYQAYPVETAQTPEELERALDDIKEPERIISLAKAMGLDLNYWPLYKKHVADLRDWDRRFESTNIKEWGIKQPDKIEEGTVIRVDKPRWKLNFNSGISNQSLLKDRWGGHVYTARHP